MLKLVSIGRPKTLANLGRIYAPILKARNVRILVGDDSVEEFNHCVWDDSRYVEHASHGKIFAVQRFNNKVIHSQVRCAECEALILPQTNKCPDPECGSSSIVNIEEKITGWVGIQRYLDSSHYGIDLIRNGRVIRTLEKEPFFTFKDPEGGDPIVDYPADDRDGRIIGEIHLNHVPVDPSKQDFEKNSPEWARALEFLRGKSSFQPKQPGADSNKSPLFMLFQGYRKVRDPGIRSMYPGKWLPGQLKPERLSRQDIAELNEKFLRKEPGYFNDEKWWELVVSCEKKPIEELKICPVCSTDCSKEEEVCPGCNHIFIGKECIDLNCKKQIQISAITCPYCGANQIPEHTQAWICEVCQTINPHEEGLCSTCHNPRGALNPLSKTALETTSILAEHLSPPSLSVKLASGDPSSPLKVQTYLTQSPIYYWRNNEKKRLPLIRITETDVLIFIDPNHPLYLAGGVTVEQSVASEVAYYIAALYHSLAGKYGVEHSLTKLQSDILEKCWPEKFQSKDALIIEDLLDLFFTIKERLRASSAGLSREIYDILSGPAKSSLVGEVIGSGRDAAEIKDMSESGEFILFLKPTSILELLKLDPKLFFDGKVWSQSYASLQSLDPENIEKVQIACKAKYVNCLETVTMFLEGPKSDPCEAKMAAAASDRLKERLLH